MNKTILITGTSSGLGISLAVQAAQQGHRVFATMRNLDKRGRLDAALAEAGVSATVLALDVQDTTSVNAAVAQVLEAAGHIDVLINNAGAGFVRSTEQATEDEIHWVTDVNYMGVVRCTKAVLPHMRERGQGHVITVSSVGGLVGQPFNEFYCAAKFAVEGYMEALASYIPHAFGVNFTVVEPGGIQTEFSNNVLAQAESTGGFRDDAYLPTLQQYIQTVQQRATAAMYQTADEVAEVVLDCMRAENPPLRRRTSAWAEDLCALKTGQDPSGTMLRDRVVRDFLGG